MQKGARNSTAERKNGKRKKSYFRDYRRRPDRGRSRQDPAGNKTP